MRKRFSETRLIVRTGMRKSMPVRLCTMLLLLGTFVFVLLFSASCKPSAPSGVLSQSEMEDVLYDYHLAQGMAETGGSDMEKNRYLYIQSVFEKHGITEAEFDSSMVWYSGHSEILAKMYKQLSERFESESKGMGIGVSETELYANLSDVGDTANIWSGSKMFVLESNRTNNLRSISIAADSTFLPGDNFMLSFSSTFIGERAESYVLMSVLYTDKKTSSCFMSVNTTSHAVLNLPKRTDCTDYQAERIFVTFFCNPTANASQHTYLCIMNTALLRMHPEKKVESEKKPGSESSALANDSTLQAGAKDSLTNKVDSLHRMTPEELRNSKEVEREINIRNDRPMIQRSNSRSVRQRVRK